MKLTFKNPWISKEYGRSTPKPDIVIDLNNYKEIKHKGFSIYDGFRCYIAYNDKLISECVTKEGAKRHIDNYILKFNLLPKLLAKYEKLA